MFFGIFSLEFFEVQAEFVCLQRGSVLASASCLRLLPAGSVFGLTAPDNENSDSRTLGGLANPQGRNFSIHWKQICPCSAEAVTGKFLCSLLAHNRPQFSFTFTIKVEWSQSRPCSTLSWYKQQKRDLGHQGWQTPSERKLFQPSRILQGSTIPLLTFANYCAFPSPVIHFKELKNCQSSISNFFQGKTISGFLFYNSATKFCQYFFLVYVLLVFLSIQNFVFCITIHSN